MKETFGEKFKAWRTSKGVSSVKIERETGISASNLISIEKGRRSVSDTVLMKLASIPDLEIDYETLKGWQLEAKYGENPLENEEVSIKFAHPAETKKTKSQSISDSTYEYLVNEPDKHEKPSEDEDVVPVFQETLKDSNLRYIGPAKNSRLIHIKGVVSKRMLAWIEETPGLGYAEWHNPTDDSPEIFSLILSGDPLPPVPSGAILTLKPCKNFQNNHWYLIRTEDTGFVAVKAFGDDLLLLPLEGHIHNPVMVKGSKIHPMWELLKYEVSSGVS